MKKKSGESGPSRMSVETDADLYENNRTQTTSNAQTASKKTKASRQNSPQSLAAQKNISPQIKIVKENEPESNNKSSRAQSTII